MNLPKDIEYIHLSTRQRMSPFPNYLSMECVTKEMKKTLGITYNFVVMIFKENMMYVFFDKKDYDRVSDYAIKKILKKPEFFHGIVKIVDDNGKDFIKELKKIASKDTSKYSDKELVSFQRFYEENYKAIYSNYFTILAVESGLSGYLKDYLKKKISDEKKVEEYFSILVTEPRSQVSGQENHAALKLAKKISENKKWISYFKNENTLKSMRADKELNALFLEHEKNYFWITRDYEDPVLAYSDFVERIGIILNDKPIEKLKEKEKYLKNVDLNIEKIEKEVGIDSYNSKLFSAMREGLHLKELRKSYVSQSLFYYDKILLEIGKRSNLTLREVRHLCIDETEKIFDDKKLQKEIKERVKLSVYMIKDKKTSVFLGDEAEYFYKLLCEVKTDVKEIKGIPVSPGIVKGKVRIIMHPNELHKMKDGEIMVSAQIVPSFVPVLKKAKGLVCDGGTGITSHPATLAREAGIPCITLTKIATKVFKDGDLVEVDAENGIVRKIEKEGYKNTKEENLAMPRKEPIKEERNDKSHADKNIVWLKDIKKELLPLVGGKGANLGEMFENFSVPNGFCITVNVYDKFLDYNKLKEKIKSALDKIDVEDTKNLEKAALKIRKMIIDAEIPAALVEEKKKHYDKLKNKKVAVRSSATAEDLPNASFAGQQDTYLNIEGHTDFVNSVKKCWASLFTSRAIYYREKNGFKHEEVKISVVVQEMVDAKYAGVMFTLDPIHKKYSLVEAVKGLGEKLVSGEVTPNTYFLDRKTFKVLETNITFDMEENVIKKVAKVGEDIERHYKKPMDVEWVIDKKDNIKIVQARPITTL